MRYSPREEKNALTLNNIKEIFDLNRRLTIGLIYAIILNTALYRGMAEPVFPRLLQKGSDTYENLGIGSYAWFSPYSVGVIRRSLYGENIAVNTDFVSNLKYKGGIDLCQ